ncbi:hypothetical protein K1719_023218 [Acacia pycnantha]|nr:hypothetical protein K1719_023218 [Acacia pycnantha]
MAGMQCSMIKDLDDSTEMWRIVVYLCLEEMEQLPQRFTIPTVCNLFTPYGPTDVIAFVISIDPLEEYYSGAEKKTKLRLVLADERGNTVPMVLYDDCASKFATHEFTTTKKPTVLLAQLARIGFDEGGRPEVCSSFNATKIHLNANFQEVAEFISSAEHLPSPTITSLTPTASTQNSTTTAETILQNTPKIKVSDIPLQEVKQICFAFPKEVDNLLGKKMILKMKLNSYNKNHPNSSVSVATYAEAADLNDAFDATTTEVGQPSLICHDKGEEIILMRNCTVEDKGPSTAKPNVTQSESLPTIDLDDISFLMTYMLFHQRGKGRYLQRNIILML